MFFDYLDQVLATGSTYSDPPNTCYGHIALRANEFYNELADWELAWNSQHHELPAKPQGDKLKISQELYDEYHARIQKAYATVSGRINDCRQ